MLRRGSLSRTFGVLSLVIIALITATQVVVQSLLLRSNLLEWERTTTGDAIRAEAALVLRPGDFAAWDSAESQARFTEFFGRMRRNSEILRVKLYGPDMRVVWSDEPRLRGQRFPENTLLGQALATGAVIGALEHAQKAENVYEQAFVPTVELYVPLALGGGGEPVTGVAEVYKDPARMFGNVRRDYLIIIATSLGGAVLLYAALFSVVHRASRQLDTQRRDLESQAQALAAANDELRATQDQLRAAERLAAVGEVSAAVAHGIRNPLANIRAAAQVALDRPDEPAAVDKGLRVVIAEVDRLRGWLQALLDAVRPFEPHPAPIDMNVTVGEVVALLGQRAKAAKVDVVERLADGLPDVNADEVHLQQALLGILENAVDASPPGALVEVGTERVTSNGRDAVMVTIRDHGEGIPAERLAKVFDAFFTTKARGTGLGLAVARRVVERHQGRVDIDSQAGAGTTVRVVLPVQGPA
jgi:signal transduction histidine kinase